VHHFTLSYFHSWNSPFG